MPRRDRGRASTASTWLPRPFCTSFLLVNDRGLGSAPEFLQVRVESLTAGIPTPLGSFSADSHTTSAYAVQETLPSLSLSYFLSRALPFSISIYIIIVTFDTSLHFLFIICLADCWPRHHPRLQARSLSSLPSFLPLTLTSYILHLTSSF